ncbi:DUF427 domain-containing protein [Pseudonocardia dioxanivorans]|uniref:DUF427 domain-containing protein n=1 Tax=Pseudonocardia dioxanivorans TaxID=240495 RepID=UPI000CD0026A|nr:DUF427 domain-containing protein [Pseudonocardia dioxanivorans]
MTRTVKIPGPDHPITIAPADRRVVVRAGGHVVASTTRALALQEADYPVVYYVPLADVDPAVLADSDTATYCPYKGDASYHDVVTAAGTVSDAAWTYREPYESVAPIAGHLAFYPDRVEIVAEET